MIKYSKMAAVVVAETDVMSRNVYLLASISNRNMPVCSPGSST